MANKSHSLSSFLEQTIAIICDSIDFTGIGLYLYDEKTKINHLICYDGLPLSFINEIKEMDMNKPPYINLVRNIRPLILENYSKFRPQAQRWNISTVASFPIVNNGEYIGCFNIASSESKRLTPFEIEILKVIGKEIGSCIQKLQYKEQIKESEKNYQHIFNAVNEAIFIQDINTCEILDVNKKTCEMFGYSKEEVRKLNISELSPGVPPYDQETALIKIKKARLGKPQVFEWLSKNKKGDLFWVEVNLKKAVLGGKDRILAVVRDINDRKLAQEEILEMSKLAATGKLAAGVAHELNTPLTNIILTTDYILELLDQENIEFQNNKIKDLLIENNNQARLCSRIIKNLLHFSRKIEINPKKFLLNSLIFEIIKSPLIFSRLNKNYIKFNNMVDEKLEIFGDFDLLFQVFQNLIINSIDALEQTKYPEIKIIANSENSNHIIRIIDNGIGIKKSDLSKVFEPFFSTKGVGKGIGLGLSISHGIIEKHGGKISIKSTYKIGTEVIVILPIKK
ncbi:MAG: ATP-binding protein [Candidatus Helarchaeota archaeon]